MAQSSDPVNREDGLATPKDAGLGPLQVMTTPDPGSMFFSPMSPTGHFGLLKAEGVVNDPNALPGRVPLLSIRLDECGIRGNSLDLLGLRETSHFSIT